MSRILRAKNHVLALPEDLDLQPGDKLRIYKDGVPWEEFEFRTTHTFTAVNQRTRGVTTLRECLADTVPTQLQDWDVYAEVVNGADLNKSLAPSKARRDK